MTGAKIRQLRELLAFDQYTFARLLGVNLSTVFRWEAFAKHSVNFTGLTNSVLELIEKAFTSRRDVREQVIRDATRNALNMRGPCAAIAALYKYGWP